MQARAPLMIEHRLIERMLAVAGSVVAGIASSRRVDPSAIDGIVDFIRTYADRTHHGKEEDILFTQLAERPLKSADRELMDELVDEHVSGRRTTAALVEANLRYRDGDDAALDEIAEKLSALADFYPRHIAKEDKVFFPAAREYFSAEEDQAMLAAFWEFDRRMIHEKYRAAVDTLAARYASA